MLLNIKWNSFDVPDSPPSPKIDVSGVLREKESVNVTCTAVVPCPHLPPRLRWNLQDSQNQTLRNVDRVLETRIVTTIRLTDRSDGVNVTCVASYPVNSTFAYATQAKTLDVSCKGFLVSIPSAKTLLQALTFAPCVPRCSQKHHGVRQSRRFAASR